MSEPQAEPSGISYEDEQSVDPLDQVSDKNCEHDSM